MSIVKEKLSKTPMLLTKDKKNHDILPKYWRNIIYWKPPKWYERKKHRPDNFSLSFGKNCWYIDDISIIGDILTTQGENCSRIRKTIDFSMINWG